MEAKLAKPWLRYGGCPLLLVGCLLVSSCESRPTRKAPVLTGDVIVAKAPELDERGEPKPKLEKPSGLDAPQATKRFPEDLWLGAAPARSFVEPEHRGQALVEIDDLKVTLEEVDVQLRSLPFTAVAGLHAPHAQQAFVEQTRDFELLAEEAKRRGLDSGAELRFLRLLLLARALRMAIYDEQQALVTEEEVAQRYQKNIFRYSSPEKRRGNLIVVATQDEAREAQRTLLEQTPRASPQRVRGFELLAQTSSQHKDTRRTGGRMRALARDEGAEDELLQTYLSQLYQLELYELSEPFAVGEQWALALFVMLIPERHMDLEHASESLHNLIASERAAKLFQEKLDTIEQSFTVSMQLQPFAALTLREEVVSPRVTKKILELPPGVGDEMVLSVGQTKVDLGMATAALGRWPQSLQEQLISDKDFAPLAERLAKLACLAEQARLDGHFDSLLVVLGEKAEWVSLLKQQIESEIAETTANEQQIEAYYHEHFAEFHRPELRRGLRIAVSTRAEALALREQLLGSAPEHERASLMKRLAESHSLDEHDRKNSGMLPYVSRDQSEEHSHELDEVSKTLREALFELDMDELSEPIEDEGRWVLLLLDGLRESADVPLSQAKASIRVKLERDPKKEHLEALIRKLAEGRRIVLHPDAMQHLHLPEISHSH